LLGGNPNETFITKVEKEKADALEMAEKKAQESKTS